MLSALSLSDQPRGGDTTAFSDIDLRVFVHSQEGNWLTRDGSDCWINGLYIDTGIVGREQYDDVATVMANPTAANDMNDAIILYDPEGFLASVQQSVRTLFMQPQWVSLRVKPHLDRLPSHIDALNGAVRADDAPNTVIHAGRISFSFALIPLFIHGVSPSSTRNLVQLEAVDMRLKQQICELEGTTVLDPHGIDDAIALLAQLTELGDTDKWGDVPEYVVKKVTWMAQNGFPRAALHTAWF